MRPWHAGRRRGGPVGWPAPGARRHGAVAFTLTELVVALAVAALVMGGLILGHLNTAKRAEWAATYLAGHARAMERLEQARAARWNPQVEPPVDELVASNFPALVEPLDLPGSVTNGLWATNTLTIIEISTNPPLRLLRSECVWLFLNQTLFTNTVVTYRAPDA